MLTESAGAASFAGGTKTVSAAATPEKLVADSTPCRGVWIGAPINADTGVGTNTKPVFIGDAAGQNVPLLSGDYRGVTIAIDDASKVFIKVGVNGEGVVYRIFV
jgi:hypothetical protein